MSSEVNLVSQKNQAVATYIFWTISDPAYIWLNRIIDKYQSLSFCLVYGEQNLNFGGAIVARYGRVVSSSSGTAREYIGNLFIR
jgi:hypothetical protein